MDTAPDEFVVTYASSAAEDQKALMSDPVRRRMMAVLWATYPAVYVYHLVQRALRGEPVDLTVALWMLIPALLFLPIPYFVNRHLVARRRRATADGTRIIRRFSSNGFALSADSAPIPWGLVTEVTETPIAFLISDASSRAQVVLPKRTMSPEHVDRLRLILRKEFQSRTKELKLLRAE